MAAIKIKLFGKKYYLVGTRSNAAILDKPDSLEARYHLFKGKIYKGNQIVGTKSDIKVKKLIFYK